MRHFKYTFANDGTYVFLGKRGGVKRERERREETKRRGEGV
jgi:hypothetical protein